jgi:hypothetical protein
MRETIDLARSVKLNAVIFFLMPSGFPCHQMESRTIDGFVSTARDGFQD